MLQPPHLRATGLDCACRGDIGVAVVLRDRADHRLGIIVAAGMVVHCVDVDLRFGETRTQCLIRIGGEGRDPALSRQEITDQRDMSDVQRSGRLLHPHAFTDGHGARCARVRKDEPSLRQKVAGFPHRSTNRSA
jgi:hypothetical protein